MGNSIFNMKFFNLVSTFALVQGSKFDCDIYEAPPKPTDVKKLNPAHVELTMAMGDSITAAFAARAGIQEDRDLSWSAGEGSKDQITFPWLISEYNRDVEGMSVKRTIPFGLEHLPHGDYHSKTDHLNFAESSGAVHLNSLDEQYALMQTAKEQYPDFDESWKVLTVWMTANDFCGECHNDLNGTDYLKNWVSKTDELLTNLTATTKNIYVNLISTLNLSDVHRLQQTTLYCKELHAKVLDECGCLDRANPD